VKVKTRVVFVVLIVSLLVVSVLLQFDRKSLQGQVVSQQQKIVTLQEEVATSQEEVVSLQEEVASLQETLKGTLPYSKTDGTPITLLNNFEYVSNPAWSELKAFLEIDDTEKHEYNYASFVCGDFAEMLHNNAEGAGIRAAVVIIHFTSGLPHAINAFYTSDIGLVYIDDTGEGLQFVITGYYNGAPIYGFAEGEDKVAYVVVGKEYGLVPLDITTSFSYDFYVNYAGRWKEYNSRVEVYNAEVDAYTSALGGRVFLEEPEYSRFMSWYNELEQERIELEKLREALGDYWYEPLGVVDSVEIYWSAVRWEP
jgi:cell division protein FtsB